MSAREKDRTHVLLSWGLNKRPREADTSGGMADTPGGADMSKRTCSIDGCDNAHNAFGLCKPHYDKEHRKDYQRPSTPPCEADDCADPSKSRGYCSKHYSRWFRYGDPLAGGPPRHVGDVKARFWQKVKKTTGCWLWVGATNDQGYGVLRIDDALVYAHRVSFELAKGPIPTGLVIDHLCETPPCVNPDHLEPVTHAENLRRGREGRQ